ncbi:hypothetical protein [Paenibacillus sp. N3.4]|uniref:hypothetical protein n=1 Tax=Paenibacillus sp. N3.4 TaxID=2603222 RepID=UPI0021C446A9|nr:hypothetical protein [Paenibacillus sp. N3.4]
MMKYSINLFGQNISCILTVENEKLLITLLDEEQKSLNGYLKRVLQKYDQDFENDINSFETLIKKGIKIEKSLSGNMSEPKIKLPYEFAPEIKEKLIEAADIQNMSATQLIIKLIEEKYQNVFGNAH